MLLVSVLVFVFDLAEVEDEEDEEFMIMEVENEEEVEDVEEGCDFGISSSQLLDNCGIGGSVDLACTKLIGEKFLLIIIEVVIVGLLIRIRCCLFVMLLSIQLLFITEVLLVL